MEEILLTSEQKKQLEMLTEQYDEASQEFTSAEAKKKSLNLILKNLMNEFGVTRFVSENGVSLALSSRPNISWKEEELIEFCKTLKIPGLIKTKSYVDMEVLESLVYNKKVTAEQLKPFQIVKPDTETLRTTYKKPLKE